MKEIKLLAAAGVGALAVALTSCSTVNQEWHNACTVQSKDVLYSHVNGTSSREYRLGTSCGAFNVEDSIAGGFNSWDTWDALVVGKVYDIHTGGYRIGFVGAFPTVIEIKAH
ncbi:hypothetical protein BKG86_17025 [Mycobacteroides chelonae]|uniref:hypothetical protein n=1 Tax=Mycobacteroides chelonae TaxID=1774 RepID=UPI0008A87220|nr:hypothetical protein [Mycobacteroides chelonae]OHU71356.1 hypothetical protein BKG86_17025 [Mycobacteroides chelonae]